MSRKTRRLRLQAKLEEILGSRNVYFQPPASITMSYPCVVYSYSGENVLHANDTPYIVRDEYEMTLISKDSLPDGIIAGIESIPYCRFNRHYTNDNLHHFSYRISLIEGN